MSDWNLQFIFFFIEDSHLLLIFMHFSPWVISDNINLFQGVIMIKTVKSNISTDTEGNVC